MRMYSRIMHVFAEPMSDKKASENGYPTFCNGEEREGYLVSTDTSYEWQPKFCFEGFYTPTDTYRDKIIWQIKIAKKRLYDIHEEILLNKGVQKTCLINMEKALQSYISYAQKMVSINLKEK